MPLRSFVVPQAAGEPMVYLSDHNQGAIFGFDRSGNNTLVINNLNEPAGLFVDSSENLWVANRGAHNVLVFAKNSTEPFMTLDDPGQYPNDVTICPNGSVYVSNFVFVKELIKGSISVYAPGSTKPTGVLQDPQAMSNYWLTCDAHNNIFTDVIYQYFPLSLSAVEKFAGARQSGFEILPINISFVGGIKTIGDDILVVDQGAATATEYTEDGKPTGRSIQGHGLGLGIAVSKSNKLLLIPAGGNSANVSISFPGGEVRHVYNIPDTGNPDGAAFDPGQGND